MSDVYCPFFHGRCLQEKCCSYEIQETQRPGEYVGLDSFKLVTTRESYCHALKTALPIVREELDYTFSPPET